MAQRNSGVVGQGTGCPEFAVVKIQITARHIKQGDRYHRLLHPLALAIRDLVSPTYHHVYMEGRFVCVDSSLSWKTFRFETSIEFEIWSVDLDLGMAQPFTFELEGF